MPGSASPRSAGAPGSGRTSSRASSRTTTRPAAVTSTPGPHPRDRRGGGRRSPAADRGVRRAVAVRPGDHRGRGLPADDADQEAGAPPGPGTALLAVLVLAVIGFAGYKFASGVGKTQRAAEPPPAPTHAGSPARSCHARVQASTAQSSPTATPSASPVATVQALTPAPSSLSARPGPPTATTRSGPRSRSRASRPCLGKHWYTTSDSGA